MLANPGRRIPTRGTAGVGGWAFRSQAESDAAVLAPSRSHDATAIEGNAERMRDRHLDGANRRPAELRPGGISARKNGALTGRIGSLVGDYGGRYRGAAPGQERLYPAQGERLFRLVRKHGTEKPGEWPALVADGTPR